MSNVRRGAFALAFIAVVFSAPRIVVANTPNKVEIPYAEVRTNPCTGEVVTLSGVTDLFSSIKATKTGGLDFTMRIKTNGSGTAVSAFDGSIVKYNFRVDEVVKFTDMPSGGFDATTISKSQLIRLGSLGEEIPTDDDWLMKELFRIKLHADGTILVDRSFLNETCPSSAPAAN
jgi:hypothetical protein